MANYRQVHVKIWKDSWFIELEPDEKLLFIYLITNDSASLAGIYELHKRIIVFESGLDKTSVDRILQRFEDDGKVYYRDGVIWVVNMRSYHETSSIKVQARIKADLDTIPYCELKIAYFKKYYPNIQYGYGIDTLSLKEEEEEENKEEEEATAAAPRFIDSIGAQQIFTEVTGMMTFPATSRDDDIERITALYQEHNSGLIDYLKPYYAKWCKSKTRDGRPYSKTNTGWLDWAVASEPLTGNEQQFSEVY